MTGHQFCQATSDVHTVGYAVFVPPEFHVKLEPFYRLKQPSSLLRAASRLMMKGGYSTMWIGLEDYPTQ